jgi:hypothetical protein
MIFRFVTACLLSIAVLPVAGTAFAQTAPYTGTWAGTKAMCGNPRAELRLTITPKEMRFYESRCALAKAEAGKFPGVWSITSTCKGEGDTWNRTDLLVLRAKNARLTLVMDDGTTVTYHRCK